LGGRDQENQSKKREKQSYLVLRKYPIQRRVGEEKGVSGKRKGKKETESSGKERHSLRQALGMKKDRKAKRGGRGILSLYLQKRRTVGE